MIAFATFYSRERKIANYRPGYTLLQPPGKREQVTLAFLTKKFRTFTSEARLLVVFIMHCGMTSSCLDDFTQSGLVRTIIKQSSCTPLG